MTNQKTPLPICVTKHKIIVGYLLQSITKSKTTQKNAICNTTGTSIKISTLSLYYLRVKRELVYSSVRRAKAALLVSKSRKAIWSNRTYIISSRASQRIVSQSHLSVSFFLFFFSYSKTIFCYPLHRDSVPEIHVNGRSKSTSTLTWFVLLSYGKLDK